jgi:hypothetical protein
VGMDQRAFILGKGESSALTLDFDTFL